MDGEEPLCGVDGSIYLLRATAWADQSNSRTTKRLRPKRTITDDTNVQEARRPTRGGPPFSAVNCCPSSTKLTVITDLLGRGAASPYRVMPSTREFSNTET